MDIRVNAAVVPSARGPAQWMAVFGDPRMAPETLLAYEAGYRVQLKSRASLDVATFYNQYDDLPAGSMSTPFLEPAPPPAHLVLPLLYRNGMRGESYGGEVAGNWNASSRWRLSAGYTALSVQLHRFNRIADSGAESAEGSSPNHQVQLRSYLDLPHGLQFDTTAHYTGPLAEYKVPGWTGVNLRLGWFPTANADLSLSVENLFDRRHVEFGAVSAYQPAPRGRSAYGKVTWHF